MFFPQPMVRKGQMRLCKVLTLHDILGPKLWKNCKLSTSSICSIHAYVYGMQSKGQRLWQWMSRKENQTEFIEVRGHLQVHKYNAASNSAKVQKELKTLQTSQKHVWYATTPGLLELGSIDIMDSVHLWIIIHFSNYYNVWSSFKCICCQKFTYVQ